MYPLDDSNGNFVLQTATLHWLGAAYGNLYLYCASKKSCCLAKKLKHKMGKNETLCQYSMFSKASFKKSLDVFVLCLVNTFISTEICVIVSILLISMLCLFK